MDRPSRSQESPASEHPVLRGLRSTVAGMFVNAILAAIKAVAGVLGNSYVLIADAAESLADIATSLIVYAGLRISVAPPDQDHPYGHGKAEPLAGLAVSLGLAIAALIIAVQSVREIITPQHGPAPFTLGVLVFVIIVKIFVSRRILAVGQEIQSTAVKADAWHHKSDALTSVAAFVGISIALIGGKGYESADDWAALFASFVMAFTAYTLARPALDEVMDAAPADFLHADVSVAAMSVPMVRAVEKCHVRKMGWQYYIDLHILVDGDLPVWRGHEIAHEVKDAVRNRLDKVADVLVHVEPIRLPKNKQK